MLPEFSNACKSIDEMRQKLVFDALKSSNPLVSMVPIRRQEEGTGWVTSRATKPARASTEYKWTPEFGRGVEPIEFFSSALRMGVDLAFKQARSLLEFVDETDTNGMCFSWDIGPNQVESFLGAMEKMWVDFTEKGEPIFPTVFLPAGIDLVSKLKEMSSDPEFARRYAEIVEAKKKSFDEREANRRLVD